MSSSDKTRQQLMDSMRKTKAGAASKKASENKAAGSKTSQPAAPAPTAKKKAARTTTRKHPAKVEVASQVETSDPYSAGRRVWPD
jgi:hypothetical protein